MCGSQGRSGRVRKISLQLGFDPHTVQLVSSRYTDWATVAIPTELSRRTGYNRANINLCNCLRRRKAVRWGTNHERWHKRHDPCSDTFSLLKWFMPHTCRKLTVNKPDRQGCWTDANAVGDHEAGPDSQLFRQPTSIILSRWTLASSYRVWLCVMKWTLPGIRIQVTLRRWSSGSRRFERYLSSSQQSFPLGLFENEDACTTILRNVGKYSTSSTAAICSRIFKRYLSSSPQTVLFELFETEYEDTTTYWNVGKYSTSSKASHPRNFFGKTAVRTSHLVLTGLLSELGSFFYYCRYLYITCNVQKFICLTVFSQVINSELPKIY
jgi:hypothetical protein